jgi:hypothetical protein
MGQQEGNHEAPEPGESPKEPARDTAVLKTAMQTLIHVLERHLLMFLYTTHAYRGDPRIKKHQYDNSLEAIPSPEVPNSGDYDDDGEFLLDQRNQRALIDHLEKVYQKFGKGQGNRPVQNVCHAHKDATGKTVREYGWEEVEGGTLPAWCPNDGCVWYLQRSTTAVLDAVCALRDADPSGRFTAIADLAKDVARPVGHPTWEVPSTRKPEKNIPWDYPSLVKEAIVKVKDAKTRIYRQEARQPKGTGSEAAAKESRCERATNAGMVAALLAAGESATVEFKSSARWDRKENRPNKVLEQVIVKTVAAFLNSEGGTLLIGVDDDRKPVGLADDYKTLGKRQDRDGYENWLTTLLLDSLGKETSLLIRTKFCELDGCDVCVVEANASPKPAYVKEANAENLYIRTGNSTRLLTSREAVEYVKQHWR